MNFEIPGSPKGKTDAISALSEGTAVTIGLFTAGAIGKQTENFFKKGVTKTAPLMDKVVAYLANNAPKVVEWLAFNYYDEKAKPTGFANVLVKDGKKGIMASVALDTFIRLNNNMAPGSFPKVFGIDFMGNQVTGGNPQALQSNLQRMVQENSSLRSQLNSAMTRLASAPTVNVQELRPPEPHDTRFGMMGTTPEAENRRNKFGAMTPPIQEERNRRYGSMNKKALNFAGEDDSVSAMYGML